MQPEPPHDLALLERRRAHALVEVIRRGSPNQVEQIKTRRSHLLDPLHRLLPEGYGLQVRPLEPECDGMHALAPSTRRAAPPSGGGRNGGSLNVGEPTSFDRPFCDWRRRDHTAPYG